jgi:2-polyprenyl-3-methyl-5-hydroxy-6-metoxy-1,4-benzoquinol methylase
MPFLARVRERHRQAEIMDQPGLDEGRHVQALRGLERINFWSRSAALVWGPLADLARDEGGRPLRALDLATGAGDVPIRLWHRARRRGLPLQVEGCDVSPAAVAHAAARAEQARADVRFFVWDALHGPLPTGYDVLVSSLFLHHLSDEQAVDLLRRAAEAAGRLVLINDLVRSPAGWLLAYLGTRLLSRCDVVHTDGLRSVEAAFTPDEARSLAERAGLTGARVWACWPCRFLLTWRRA